MKVLFVAEAVTLAHVGRTMALASALHTRGSQVDLALAGSARRWQTPYPQHELPGIGPVAFAEALRTGKPVLQESVLRTSVAADIQLLRKLRPDLVVGDFRLSLSVSARLERVAYATLTNAYWSEACRLPMPLPVLPITRVLPLSMAGPLFAFGSRFVIPQHVAPMNAVRTEFGLPSLGSSLQRVYSDADHVLFADIPGMFTPGPLPANHHELGPILWAPPAPLPAWWASFEARSPSAYVTLGSSGDPRALRRIVEALLHLNVQVIASTAGSPVLDGLHHPLLRCAPYLPGDEAALRTTLVVCNGGSMGCQQALAAGRPVLGVCGNMDQFLNMQGVEGLGVGLGMRADRLARSTVELAVRRIQDPAFASAAQGIGERIRALDPGAALHALLPRLAAG